MSASLEPKLYSWLVEIPLSDPDPGFRETRVVRWTHAESNKVTKIREQFVDAGFKLVEMPMDYYNPNSKRRFKAKHEHSAAMTMMLLSLKETQFTVVDENHYQETT